MRGMEFVAVDFETANGSRASVCQVGVARVVDGVIAERHCWPVVPPTGADDFAPANVRVHGIDADAVRGAMDWTEAAERLAGLVGMLPVVAHNAAFDADVYAAACAHEGLVPVEWEWVDSLALADRFLDANRRDLPSVVHALGLPPFNHHDAGADAASTAAVVLELGRRFGATTLGDLLSTWPARDERVVAVLPSKARPGAAPDGSGSSVRVKDLPQPNPDADPGHPLHGHRVVLTGELEGYSRMEAWATLAALGAQPQKGVRKDTTILVVSEALVIDSTYPTHLATEKVRKAARYIANGQQLVLMTGSEMLACLDSSNPAPVPAVREIPVAEEPARKPTATRSTTTRPAGNPAATSTFTPADAEPPTRTRPRSTDHVPAGGLLASPTNAPREAYPAAAASAAERAGKVRAWGLFAAVFLGGALLGSIPAIGPLLALIVWGWAAWKLRADLRALKARPAGGPGQDGHLPA